MTGAAGVLRGVHGIDGPPSGGLLFALPLLVRLCEGRAAVSPQHPLPADVPRLIEIADSSLRHDGTTELSLYARAGAPRYRIVDVRDRSIVEFTRPDGERCLAQRRLRAKDRIGLGDEDAPLEGLEIDVGELFG